jgi:hypothetical protein
MKKLYSTDIYKRQQHIKERRSLVKRSRISKKYKSFDYPNYVKTRTYVKTRRKQMPTPENFSLLHNNNESLKFFDDFFKYIDDGYVKFNFNMRDVQDLSIETLLYIISLDKIYREKINISLNITPPIKKELQYKIRVSGFLKYFKPTRKIQDIDEDTIFPICDGATNKKNDKDDGATCGEAVDFAKKFIDKSKHKDQIYRLLYTTLAELMLNTEYHAYDIDETNDDEGNDEEDEPNIIDNWYLFAVKLEKGVAFYFFDNGKGIAKTARVKIIDKAYRLIGLEQTNILQSVLKGEFRSRTGIGHRGKGLPQINEFLTDNSIKLSVILTNKVFSISDNNATIPKYEKVKYNFRGSLFVWVLPFDSEEIIDE